MNSVPRVSPRAANREMHPKQVAMLEHYKPYPAYKDSGVEWLGKIPAHWCVTRISELTTLVNGYPFNSEYFVRGEGTPLVRIRDLSDAETEVNYVGPIVEAAWIQPGDVIVGMDGDFNVARWRGRRALLNQRMCCLRQRGDTDSAFISYTLPIPLKVVNDLTYSTTVKHLSSVDVRKIRLGAPPGPEQCAIASFLDRETARIDQLVARKERLIELLQEQRTALITRAVTKGLDPNVPMKDSGIECMGKVPAHWQVTRVRNLLNQIEQGWSPDCENREAGDDEWGVLKAGCVNRGVFDASEHKALPASLEPIPGLEVREGDLLMSRASGSRDLVGSVALVPHCRTRLLLCDKVFRLHVAPEASYKPFLAYSLNSRIARWQIEIVLSGGSGLANNIAQGVVKDLVIVVPTREEQQVVAAFLDRETARIDALVAKILEATKHLKELRTALISAAVTGKIDVREEAA